MVTGCLPHVALPAPVPPFVRGEARRPVFRARQRHVRGAGAAMGVPLLVQIGIGIGIVWLRLPLWLSDTRTAGAALARLSSATLNHVLRTSREPVCTYRYIVRVDP